MEIKGTDSFKYMESTQKPAVKPDKPEIPEDKVTTVIAGDPDLAKMEQLSRRTGEAAEVIFKSEPNKELKEIYRQWEVEQSGSPRSNTVYDPETKTAYTAMGTINNAYLTAIDDKGNVKWTFDEEVVNLKGGPVLDGNGNTYFRSDWKLYAVDKDGKKKWDFPIRKHVGLSETPVRIGGDGTVYASTIGGLRSRMTLMAIKDENGEPKVKWSYKSENPYKNMTPLDVGKDGTIYLQGVEKQPRKGLSKLLPFGNDDDPRKIIALDPNNGKEIFKLDVPEEIGGEIYLADGPNDRVYVTGILRGEETDPTQVRISAFSKKKGGVKEWDYDMTLRPGKSGRNDQMCLSHPPCVDDRGNIIIATDSFGKDNNGYMVCLDPDGNEKWNRAVTDDGYSTRPTIGPDGNIYTGSWRGNLNIYGTDGSFVKKINVGKMSTNNFCFNDKGEVILNTDGKTVAIQPDFAKIPQEVKDRLDQLNRESGETQQENPDLKIEKDDNFVVIGGVKLPKRKKE